MKLYEFIFKSDNNIKAQYEDFEKKTKQRLKIQQRHDIRKIFFDSFYSLKKYFCYEVSQVGTTINDSIILLTNNTNNDTSKIDKKKIQAITKKYLNNQ
jgi:hypothetical protein